MNLAVYKGKGILFSQLIRTWTRGPYSHVELVLAVDGDVMRCLSASEQDGGVREKLITQKLGHWDIVELPLAPAADLDHRIRDELGCAYDWVGIFFS